MATPRLTIHASATAAPIGDLWSPGIDLGAGEIFLFANLAYPTEAEAEAFARDALGDCERMLSRMVAEWTLSRL